VVIQSLSMPKKILLFIPGYYGSILFEEKTKNIRWVSFSSFITSQRGLADDIPGTNIGSKTKLLPGEVLGSVKIIGGIWEADAYKKVLQQLESYSVNNGMTLDTVSYDWRADFVECLKALDNKIKSLNLNDEDELYIVGHSTGGLLLAYYLRYGAQDVDTAEENWEGTKHFKKVALVAPPLHGLMVLLRDMRDGTRMGLNRSLLSARDYSTFKSSYFFLPPKGEDIGLKDGARISLGIHDIDKWQSNKWGPFKFAKESEIPAVRSFVEKNMHRSEKFYELLRAPVKLAPRNKIPLLHMVGLGHKTLELATIKVKGDRTDFKFKSSGTVNGDGTVTAKSSEPLSFFKELDFNYVETKFGHLNIIAHPEAQSMIQDFLQKPVKI
jgi:pimeloyl-ACP methyl ester carboxylesterase